MKYLFHHYHGFFGRKTDPIYKFTPLRKKDLFVKINTNNNLWAQDMMARSNLSSKILAEPSKDRVMKDVYRLVDAVNMQIIC